MSKQNINLGAAPTGQGGDTPRSANVKIGANFDEVYAALGASGNPQTLPSALPIEKGGTGGTTAAAARSMLGLGTAATRAVGLAPGNLLEVGAYGLGQTFTPGLSVITNANAPVFFPTGLYQYSPETGGRPDYGSGYGFTLTVSAAASGGTNYGGQIFIDYLSNRAGFRTLGASGFSAHREFYHTGNTTRASDGTLKAI